MRQILLLLIFSFFIFSCKKTETNVSTDIMNFEINLLTTNPITIYQGLSKIDIAATIKWTEGKAENITLTAGSLPAGVSFNPVLPKTYDASTFTLNTPSTIVLPELTVANNTVAGTYPIVLTATSSNGTTKTLTINLIIARCITQTENSSVGVYKGNWKILTINALADTLSITNFLGIPDGKVYITSKALNPLIFTATVSGNNLTIADISLPTLPLGVFTLTNLTVNGTGSFDCSGKVLSLTLNFVSGNLVVGAFPLSIAGQSFSGTFTR